MSVVFVSNFGMMAYFLNNRLLFLCFIGENKLMSISPIWW